VTRRSVFTIFSIACLNGAARKYEQEYSIHQFTVLPSETNQLFQFTHLSMIIFPEVKSWKGRTASLKSRKARALLASGLSAFGFLD
jgi:hypothetical protein